MATRFLSWIVGSWLLTGVVLAQADREPTLKELVAQPWAESVKKFKWPEADIRQLEQNKLLISDESYRQAFDPYFNSPVPVFITSDSILNAYQVLFEDSIQQVERAQAVRLPRVLRAMWNGLDDAGKWIEGDEKLVGEAKRRACLVVATAIRLLGEDLPMGDEMATAVAEEVKKVTEARLVEKPQWLGPPDPGFVAIDHSRFRPRGFYTQSPELERYFRAVSWLQAIPFRAEKEEELLAILMLGKTVTHGRPMCADAIALEEAFTTLLGGADDLTLRTAMSMARNELALKLPADLEAIGELLAKSAGDNAPQISDQLRADGAQKPQVSFRILPSHRTPDGVLFQRTTAPELKRPYPDGLEVAALLGSDYARSRLRLKPGDELTKAIDGCSGLVRKEWYASVLYQRYLQCLAALLEKPEKDAPALFDTDAWRIKSCQTALGGWAQLRHTWTLQAKQSEDYWGGTSDSAGFVEPVPEFYARMAALAERTEKMLDAAGAFEQVDNTPAQAGDDSDEAMQTTGEDARKLWRQLALLCRRLEALAHKQLRGVPFNEEEEAFLKAYGQRIAALMLYKSNSYESPKDDAPRVADVFANPQEGKVLEVGIGRARAIYVLYPWQGREVLCRGAVMPYFEFRSPQRLTDGEWKKLLDSPQRPKPPVWAEPIYSKTGFSRPKTPVSLGEDAETE